MNGGHRILHGDYIIGPASVVYIRIDLCFRDGLKMPAAANYAPPWDLEELGADDLFRTQLGALPGPNIHRAVGARQFPSAYTSSVLQK